MWRLKILAKIILARVPIPHEWFVKAGMFRHTDATNAARYLKVFRIHASRAYPGGLPQGLTLLELGPGDYVVNALIAAAHGAQKIYLMDVSDDAGKTLSFYKTIARDLEALGLAVPDIQNAQSFEEMLQTCNAVYKTDGLKDLQSIPDNSVDFIWSHSVLEHVRKKDFAETMKELRRIVKPDGFVSHDVDLQDHLNHALNNLRFSEKLWENDFFASSGFYTNRIQYSKALEHMRAANFEIVKTDTGQWPQLPTPQKSMAPEFQNLSEEELRIRAYHVLLKAA